MGSLNINFSEVESGSFDAIPEGAYTVVIDKVEVRESNSSDHDYLNWEMTVADGEYEGRKLWTITSFSPKALFKLKDFLDVLGFDMEAEDFEFVWDEDVPITPKEGPLLIEPDLTAMTCIAIVHNELYKNKEQNRVDDLRAEGDPPEEEGARPKSSSSSKSTSSSKGNGQKKTGTAQRRRALR